MRNYSNHVEEMKDLIFLAESASAKIEIENPEIYEEAVFVEENNGNTEEQFIRKLKDTISEWKNHIFYTVESNIPGDSGQSDMGEYGRGYEEGLYQAGQDLERILIQFGKF